MRSARLCQLHECRCSDAIALLRRFQGECRRALLRLSRPQLLARRIEVEVGAADLNADFLSLDIQRYACIVGLNLRALSGEAGRAAIEQRDRQADRDRSTAALVELVGKAQLIGAAEDRVVAGTE